MATSMLTRKASCAATGLRALPVKPAAAGIRTRRVACQAVEGKEQDVELGAGFRELTMGSRADG